ncbi:MAG TPA: hypothetical protein VJ281_05720 [Chthoniobacterales bacterium]|jgi:hypothetical protein|nr:hypothetical protein [Chthoniobacterales bacterium]
MKETFYPYRTTENKIDNMIGPFKLLSMNPFGRSTVCFFCAIFLTLSAFSSIAATLDDLKKLEITCLVPSYLPTGFKLKKVEITYEDVTLENGQAVHAPDYSIEWRDGKRSFSVESAAEGVGDRNLMEEEDTEETELKTMLGPVYIIYRPKGKAGNKIEILTNWYEDERMKAQLAKNTTWHGELGRFHGFTGKGISVAEFQKILDSLHPIKSDGSKSEKPKETGGAPEVKLHPKIFNLIECWISDVESPVVTEISLDAVDKNGNEFNDDGLKVEGEWTRCPNPDSKEGFMRFRVLESKGNHYKVEYQENGGGTLTTASIIEFDIQKRNIQRDGKPANIRVLRLTSYNQK